MATNKKRSPRIAFLGILLAGLFGFGVYQKTGEFSSLYAGLAIICLIIFLLLFERKVRISEPGELSAKAENRLDGIRAILFLLMGTLCVVNMYTDFAMGTVYAVAVLLCIGIIAWFFVRKKK